MKEMVSSQTEMRDSMDRKALEDKSEPLAGASAFLADGEASLPLKRQGCRNVLRHRYGIIPLS